MIHFGDVTVERSGDTFVYKRGENSLIDWTIGCDTPRKHSFTFMKNWKKGDESFSFSAGNSRVDVDMRNGTHCFRWEDYKFQVIIAKHSDEVSHFIIDEGTAFNRVASRVYEGGAILKEDYSWIPVGEGKLVCVIGNRNGIIDGVFQGSECKGTWSYKGDDHNTHTLKGTFKKVGEVWRPKPGSVMKSYATDFASDTNSCIYVVGDREDDGYFCVEETYILKGKRRNGYLDGEYDAYMPNDLLKLLKYIDQSDSQNLLYIDAKEKGMEFKVSYKCNQLESVSNYQKTVDGKIWMISYKNGYRTVTIDSISYEDSFSVPKRIRDVTRTFSIHGKEGYQEEDGVRITGLWDSQFVKGRIVFPNGVLVEGRFDRVTKQPQGKCTFLEQEKMLFQLEYNNPYVVFDWMENGYQFHGEYLFSLWKSDSRSNKDNQPDRLWLSFLSTLAKQGVTFTERYENAAVSNAEKKWMEMTLFRKEFLRSECEEFLKSYCANCYYSKRVLKLLNRTSSALMTLKYGQIDPVVPKWADSYYPHGSASYSGNKKTFFFYGKETILKEEKEEGGRQLGSFTVHQLTHPTNRLEENLMYPGNKKKYEEYSVCRRGLCDGMANKDRSSFKDGYGFNVYRGKGEIKGDEFVMVEGTVRVVFGEYVLKMQYNQVEDPKKTEYELVEEKQNDAKGGTDSQLVTYKGLLEFENGIPIRCKGRGCFQVGEDMYTGFFTDSEILCCRLYSSGVLQFGGTVSIKSMESLYGLDFSNYALGGNGHYWKISDDWTKVEMDSQLDNTCPLFHHRFICIQGEEGGDPYVLVVDKDDKVQYDLSNKTVTFAGTNVIPYSSLKSFSLPSLCE